MDENGSGMNARFDRIERVLEQTVITVDRLADKVDYVADEMKSLLRSQILMQDQVDTEARKNRERQKQIDERIEKLVMAVGALIARENK